MVSSQAVTLRGFGEWLQTVSLLDAQRGYFAAVDALRDGIHLIDIPNRRRRFIATPPHWTIQTVTRIPEPMLVGVAQATISAQRTFDPAKATMPYKRQPKSATHAAANLHSRLLAAA